MKRSILLLSVLLTTACADKAEAGGDMHFHLETCRATINNIFCIADKTGDGEIMLKRSDIVAVVMKLQMDKPLRPERPYGLVIQGSKLSYTLTTTDKKVARDFYEELK